MKITGSEPGKCQAIIFSGPSGSGKSTIVQNLLARNTSLAFSVSACTRLRRPQEVHGRDYYFLSVQDFRHKIVQEEFVEWQEVYADHYYGTLKAEVSRIWAADKIAVFDIDVHGALRLKDYFRENALAVYVQVPSAAVLAQRLAKRGTESDASTSLRLAKATAEAKLAPKFDVVLMNEALSASLKAAQKLLDDFRH